MERSFNQRKEMHMTDQNNIDEIKKTVQENLTPFEEFIALETVSTQDRP